MNICCAVQMGLQQMAMATVIKQPPWKVEEAYYRCMLSDTSGHLDVNSALQRPGGESA